MFDHRMQNVKLIIIRPIDDYFISELSEDANHKLSGDKIFTA